MPPYGFHPPPPGHHFGGRPGNRRHSEREKEETGKKHDFHPFDHGPQQVGTKRKWSDEREQRPKLLVKEREWREGEEKTAGGGNRRNSKSSPTAAGESAPQVSLGSHPKEAGEEEEGEREEHSPPVAMMRAQPKKIMLRKMSDGSKSDSNEGQEKETSDRVTDSKSNVRKISGEQESSDAADSVTKSRPTAWKTSERSVGSAVKTLYEPEGKKSEAKFRKYQHDARGGGGGGKRERSGPSPATTPSDPNPPVVTPDSAGREKVSLKRTPSGGDKGRRGRDKFTEEDNLKWAEPPKSQRDQQDWPGGQPECSVPLNEQPKEKFKAPEQQEEKRHGVEGGRGGGRRERNRMDRRSRGSEADEGREEGRGKSRPGSESEPNRWQRDDGPASPHHRRTRGERGLQSDSRGPRTHRLPSKEDRAPSKEGRLPSREPPKGTPDIGKNKAVHSGPAQEPTVSQGPVGTKKPSIGSTMGETLAQKENRIPSKEDKPLLAEDKVPSRAAETQATKEVRRDLNLKPSGVTGNETPPTVTTPNTVAAGNTSVSTALARTMVPTTTATMTTVSMVHASVPQSVINKSVMAQTSTESPPIVKLPLAPPPLATPIHPPLAPPTQLPPQSVRKPLLDDPPLPLRQVPSLTGRHAPSLTGRQGPSLTGRHAPSLTGRQGPLTGRQGPLTGRQGPLTGRQGPSLTGRQGPLTGRQGPSLTGRQGPSRQEASEMGRRGADSADGRRRQPEKKRGDGEAGRGGRRGSQRGRSERGGRDEQQERQDLKLSSSGTAESLVGESERGRERGGRGRGNRERKPSLNEKKPAQQEVEGGKRGEGGGRGRDKRRNRGRKSEFSRTDSGERPQRRSRDSGREERRGGREEQRAGGGKEFGRERQNKPSSVQEETKIVNLATGYGSLEDIDSGSDWEEWEEEKGAGKVGETRKEAGETTESREPPKGRGRGQRRGQDSLDQQRSSSRGGGGKGRGRGRSSSEQTARERQGGRPGSSRQDRVSDSRVSKPEPSLAAAPEETASSEKPSDVHKQQEFAKYDLHSSTIAIVDDIRGTPDEAESAVEFVEVTSKKAQKEKVKKEREEQWRQSMAADEQRKNRKPVPAAKSSEETSLPLKPSMAWSSKGEDQNNIWSTSTAAPASDWGIIRHSTSVPGAEPAGSWVSASSSVGVIGDTLQARSISTALSGQSELLPSSSGYSLFSDYSIPSLLSPGQYAGGGSMLNAAVNMKLSQEHISSGETTVLAGQPPGVKKSAPLIKKEADLPQRKTQVVQPPLSTQNTSSPAGTRGEQSVPQGGGSRSFGSDLPPRLQSSRSAGSGVGRGRGGGRGRRVDRGRRGGSGERREQQDVPGEGKKESQQAREHPARDKVNL